MSHRAVTGIFILVLLAGCGGGGGSDEHAYITTPNGLTFNVVSDDISYEDSISPEETHHYAIQVRPGYHYSVYLDTTRGDADLYLYYDYILSGQSLLAYSDLPGPVTDSNTFYSDFSGVVYIEVYGVIDSQYLISVTESLD